MLEYLQSLSPRTWGIVAIIAFGVLYSVVWPNLGALWGKLTGMVSLAKTDPEAARKAARKVAVSHFDDAVSYLEDQHCTAGVNAMKAALPHFYAEHPHEGHPA